MEEGEAEERQLGKGSTLYPSFHSASLHSGCIFVLCSLADRA